MRKSEAIQELERLATEAARAKYPKIKPEWLAPRTFKVNSANSLTKAVIAYIQLNGGQAERISNTGRMVNQTKQFVDVMGFNRQVGSAKYIKGSGTRGTADISAVIRGNAVKIEIKWAKDRQSDVQKEYQKSIETAGGTYLIVRTFEEFYTWFNEYITI